jgi:sugar O-acyltransferase (sialic acid O-acetyltransferase NeuD family)
VNTSTGGRFIVIGAGGHAAVVADALLATGGEVLGFMDADPARKGAMLCGRPVLGDDGVLGGFRADDVALVNGIGGVRSTALRRTVQSRLMAEGWRFAGVRHPTAIISPLARLAPDVQVLAGAIVQVGATLGSGTIVNTAAVVEHDCAVGEFVHIAPRALLCGDVRVGDESHVGAGAVVRQGLQLGRRTVAGAGAVVVKNSEGGALLVGMPARPRGTTT